MLAHERLVALHLRRGIYLAHPLCRAASRIDCHPEGSLPKPCLDPVVDGKVDRPSGEVPQDGGTKSTIHSAQAIAPYNLFDSFCIGVALRR